MMTLPIHEPVLVYGILMLVMLAAPLLANRLRTLDIIVLILIGVALGPHASGILERGDAIRLLGAVGLLFIMLLAGMEIDLHELRRARLRSILFGCLTFSIPFAVGTGVGRWICGYSWPVSLLFGSLFSSHSPLAYPVVSRLGLARTQVVTVALGGTVITDVAALLVLAGIVGTRGGTLDLWVLVRLFTGSAILLLAITLLIPRGTRWFFRHVRESGGQQFLFIMVILFGCGAVAKLAGLEPIVGAFLAGLTLNRLVPEHSALMNRIQFVGRVLFIPCFVLSIGMLVDPGKLLSDPHTWLVILAMLGTIFVTKAVAAFLSGRFCRYSRPETGILYAMSLPQAGTTLATVLVGYQVGLFETAVVDGAVIMLLATCVFAPWLLDRLGRRVAGTLAERPPPEGARAQRILVPLANPATSNDLLHFAFLWRDLRHPGMIYPLTVLRDERGSEQAVAEGERLLTHCLAHAAGADIPVTPMIRLDTNPADGIARAARELRADTLLVGWHGANHAADFLFSDLLDQLLASCPQRIVMCRLCQPPAHARALRLVLPPLALRTPGFGDGLDDLLFLARQAGTRVEVYAPVEDADDLRTELTARRGGVPWELHPCDSAEQLADTLAAQVAPDDLLVFCCGRNGTLAWNADYAALAEQAPAAHPRHNVLVVCLPFPADAELPDATTAVGETFAPEAGSPLHAVQWLHPYGFRPALAVTAAAQAMTELAAAAEAREPGAETPPQLVTDLCAAAEHHPTELIPGVVLVHVHAETAVKIELLLGTSPAGIPFPGSSVPAHVIVVLLTPADAEASAHLDALAAVARTFADPELVPRLLAARDFAEVETLLREFAPSPEPIA